MNELELYTAHCNKRGEDALPMKAFMYRLNDGKKIRTEDQLINTPPKGFLKKKYKEHTDLHGDRAVKLNSFRRRIYKHGREVDRAIATPSRENNRELKMSLKKIWKRLKQNGLRQHSYAKFISDIEIKKIDLLEVATVEELSGLKLYKRYKKEIFNY